MNAAPPLDRKSTVINRVLPIGLILGLSLLLAWTSPTHVRVALVDARSGEPLPGVVRATASRHSKVLTIKELLPRGQGLEEIKDPSGGLYPILDWYSLPSEAEITLPRKQIFLEAFSGLESELARVDLDLRKTVPEKVTIPIRFFSQISRDQWYGGNTHLHLDDLDIDGARRYLSEIPYVDRLDILFISYLERGISPSKPRTGTRADASYITNRFPIGELDRFQQDGPLLSNGEEHRNNLPERTGYGHVMLLGIRELIRPVSIGRQIEGEGSDGVPLQKGILEAKRQGGTSIWCHNQYGWEDVPNFIAGNLDALNMYDGGPERSAYDTWYQYLNAGLRVPISTGTDWFMYDLARVYVQFDGPLSTKSWLQALAEGRSFITNGPLLKFEVEEKGIGEVVSLSKPGSLRVTGVAQGRHPFGRLELIRNGNTVSQVESIRQGGHFKAKLDLEVQVDEPSWLALRTEGSGNSYYGRPLFSHTSAIHVSIGGKLPKQSQARKALLQEMEKAVSDIQRKAVFFSEKEREGVLSVYRRGIETLRSAQ